jgi:PmbA protein
MDFNSFKEAIIARCQELGVTEYELYYQAAESTCISAYQSQINEFSGNTEGGVCFRCIAGGKMGYASTEELSLAQAHQLVSRALDNAKNLETVDKVFLGQGGQSYEQLQMRTMALPSTEELVQSVLTAQKALYDADASVVDGTVTEGICEKKSIAICNSNGLDLNYVNQITGLITVAVVSKDGEMSNHFKIKLAEPATIDYAQLAGDTVKGALDKLGGEPPATGTYPVVFDPDAMASLLQTYSGIFSAEAAQKGLSQLAGLEGTAIASKCVTIVDDPFHPDSTSPIHFDAEGSPTFRKNLIEQGKLNTLLYNLKTADKAGKATTGNASKASYSAPVGIRPFTMYIAGGALTEEQLLQKVENGIYITALEGLHAGANAVSGDFSLQSEGYRIENGVKTEHIKSFTVAGNFYELLKKITAVADNMKLHNPLGTTSFGAPSVLVDSLSIAGK